MKSTNILIMIGLLCWLLPQTTEAQGKKSKREKREAVFQRTLSLIQSDSILFVPNRAFPQGFQSIDLTTNYGFVKMTGDTVESDMPFFGRRFINAGMGNPGGIKFKSEMLNKKVEVNERRRRIIISFDVKDSEHYQVVMEVSTAGVSSVNFTSNNRSFISYHGTVEPLNKANAD